VRTQIASADSNKLIESVLFLSSRKGENTRETSQLVRGNGNSHPDFDGGLVGFAHVSASSK
jgi:hypothetical protein